MQVIPWRVGLLHATVGPSWNLMLTEMPEEDSEHQNSILSSRLLHCVSGQHHFWGWRDMSVVTQLMHRHYSHLWKYSMSTLQHVSWINACEQVCAGLENMVWGSTCMNQALVQTGFETLRGSQWGIKENIVEIVKESWNKSIWKLVNTYRIMSRPSRLGFWRFNGELVFCRNTILVLPGLKFVPTHEWARIRPTSMRDVSASTSAITIQALAEHEEHHKFWVA